MRLLIVLFTVAMFWTGAAMAGTDPGAVSESDLDPPGTAQFFSDMQDVPLVPGLTELPDQSVAFDKPEGRIVEAVAEMDSFSPQAITKAYDETLPQLGWVRIGERSYSREKESLTLTFESYGGRNFVRVLVRPLDRIGD